MFPVKTLELQPIRLGYLYSPRLALLPAVSILLVERVGKYMIRPLLRLERLSLK
jgi:hypothetical protein